MHKMLPNVTENFPKSNHPIFPGYVPGGQKRQSGLKTGFGFENCGCHGF